MTERKHLKALIRARMARTGESYAAARSHIVRPDERPSLTALAEFRAHDKHCMTAVFTPDGGHLVSGGFGGQARIWTLDGNPAGELVGHESAVSVVRISPDGGMALTASSDKTVRIWDLPTRQQRLILGPHRKQVLALDLDAARDRVWSGDHDGRLNAWSLTTGSLESQSALGGSVSSVAIRHTDGLVAASTVGAGVAIVRSDGVEVTRLLGGRELVASLTWAADGTFLLGSSPGGATIWATHEWEAVRSLETGPGSMLPVALSPDGSRIALGWDHHVGLWSADETQSAVSVDGLPKGVYGLSFSSDGRRLAAASADGRVRIWSVT
jgi:eukaryotic-like serine/threonine-protein kinase